MNHRFVCKTLIHMVKHTFMNEALKSLGWFGNTDILLEEPE